MTERALVVGAGITGLAAAFRLQQAGFEVTVLEAQQGVGGKTAALRREGFTINRGAAVLPASYSAFRRLAGDVGLAGQLSPIDASLRVPRDGRIHELRISGRGAVVDALRTGLLSPRAKFDLRHVAADALKLRRSMSYTNHEARASVDNESVGDYCARRLGPEAHEWAIDPLTRGLWVVDPDPISSVDLFFALVKMFGPGMLSYPPGMDFLCRGLAERVDVRTGATVSCVERRGSEARVTWHDGAQEHEEVVAACVVAVTAPIAARITPCLDEGIQQILLREIAYTDTITASFALSRRPPGDQLATVLASRESDGLAIVPFTHVSSPQSVPDGKGLVAGYWTSEWSTAHIDLDDDALMAKIVEEMTRVVPSIESDTEFVNVERWRLSTVKSRPGLHKTIAELAGLLNPSDPVQLAGDYFGPPNLESCVLSAEQATRNVVTRLGRRGVTSGPGRSGG